MYRAYAVRASRENSITAPLLSRILELRRARAELLGFRNFADLVLHDRMAHTGERAEEFLKDLKAQDRGAIPRAKTRTAGIPAQPGGRAGAGAAAVGRGLLRGKTTGRAVRF